MSRRVRVTNEALAEGLREIADWHDPTGAYDSAPHEAAVGRRVARLLRAEARRITAKRRAKR